MDYIVMQDRPSAERVSAIYGPIKTYKARCASLELAEKKAQAWAAKHCAKAIVCDPRRGVAVSSFYAKG